MNGVFGSRAFGSGNPISPPRVLLAALGCEPAKFFYDLDQRRSERLHISLGR